MNLTITTLPGKDPYRNQIDYILSRKNISSKIFDSRSFNSNSISSDHKPVITKIRIKWMHTKKTTVPKCFNLSKLQITQISENNMNQVNEIIKKLINYKIKPGRMEQYYKSTKNIS